MDRTITLPHEDSYIYFFSKKSKESKYHIKIHNKLIDFDIDKTNVDGYVIDCNNKIIPVYIYCQQEMADGSFLDVFKPILNFSCIPELNDFYTSNEEVENIAKYLEKHYPYNET